MVIILFPACRPRYLLAKFLGEKSSHNPLKPNLHELLRSQKYH